MIEACSKARQAAGLSLTGQQCEYIADGLRQAGFLLPDDFSNDDIALLAQVIIDAMTQD